jgi:hypothetical protein
MVTFFHLSDIHISDNKRDLWDTVDPCVKFEKLIELAEKLELHPSFPIVHRDYRRYISRARARYIASYRNRMSLPASCHELLYSL